MLLDLRKRNMLLMVLPKTGSVEGQLRCKELVERLTTLSEEYKEQVEFKDNGNGSFNYNLEKDVPAEFSLSESEVHVLKRGVKALDDAEQVPLELADICKEIELM